MLNENKHNTIVIAGGGIAGLFLALHLSQEPSWNIIILGGNSINLWQFDDAYERVSALSLSSYRLLKSIDAWPAIMEKRASPFYEIQVLLNNNTNALKFSHQDIRAPLLGWIVENNVIQTSLCELIQTKSTIHYYANEKLSHWIENESGLQITAVSGKQFSADLLIGADGASSPSRSFAHIETKRHSYEEHALTTVISCTKPHSGAAVQRFIKNEIIAFLPLADAKLYSIVWSAASARIDDLLQKSTEDFADELKIHMTDQMGEITQAFNRYSFPLFQLKAKRYICNRFALLGDAAHVIHPLAGQGLNLGLQDAKRLQEILFLAKKEGKKLGDYSVLRRYERASSAENFLMQNSVHHLRKIFGASFFLSHYILSQGLNSVHHSTWLKRFLIKQAV